MARVLSPNEISPYPTFSSAPPPRSLANREPRRRLGPRSGSGDVELLRADRKDKEEGKGVEQQNIMQLVKNKATENKYSLEAKLKLALLNCMFEVASQRECQVFVSKVVGSCTWHTLPLLCSLECAEVVQAARALLQAALNLDASLVTSLLFAASQPHEVGLGPYCRPHDGVVRWRGATMCSPLTLSLQTAKELA